MCVTDDLHVFKTKVAQVLLTNQPDAITELQVLRRLQITYHLYRDATQLKVALFNVTNRSAVVLQPVLCYSQFPSNITLSSFKNGMIQSNDINWV